MEIKRSEIKHNFLRRIILRIDYNGIIDIKDTIKELQSILPKHGFVEMSSGFINEIEFEINDPIMIETQMTMPVKELQKTESFKFRTEDKSTTLEISKLFASLTITVNKYKRFEDYSNSFLEVVDYIRARNIYLKPLRLGLRKINDCIIKDKSIFGELFNPEYFSDISVKLDGNGLSARTVNSQTFDTFCDEQHFYNYIRVLSDATLNIDGTDKETYQVVLDIDGYTNDIDVLSELIKDKARLEGELISINNTIFKLYINTLNDELIKNLRSERFEIVDMLGVNNNDGV